MSHAAAGSLSEARVGKRPLDFAGDLAKGNSWECGRGWLKTECR